MSGALCLGDPVVDLFARAPADSLRAATGFEPHLGGATANVAVAASRAGARVTLAGATGDDRWGRWLRDRLREEGVDDGGLQLRDDVATQLAFVAVDRAGEPTYEMYAPALDTLALVLGDEAAVHAAVDDASGVFISSNTLAGADERAATMRVRERARQTDTPIVLDVNLRLHRWSTRTDAMASVNACVPEALLVRANRAEASLLTGEDDPDRAAHALRKTGARVAVITLGADGALLRGDRGLRLRLAAAAGPVRCTVGAGDALTGTLLAALERSGWYADAAAAALDDALAAAAAACGNWGALD